MRSFDAGCVLRFADAGLLIKAAQYLKTGLYLIALYLLRNEKLHALAVVIAAELLECLGLVVLTAEPHHEYGAGIGMMHHVAEYLSGILMIASELRAAIVVSKCHDIVDTLTSCLFLRASAIRFYDAVDTPHGGDYPHLVAYAGLAVGAQIAFEGTLLAVAGRTTSVGFLYRDIRIVECAGEIGGDCLMVEKCTLGHSVAHMADRESVFHHILPPRR